VGVKAILHTSVDFHDDSIARDKDFHIQFFGVGGDVGVSFWGFEGEVSYFLLNLSIGHIALASITLLHNKP
jgi:hypothetical protein